MLLCVTAPFRVAMHSPLLPFAASCSWYFHTLMLQSHDALATTLCARGWMQKADTLLSEIVPSKRDMAI